MRTIAFEMISTTFLSPKATRKRANLSVLSMATIMMEVKDMLVEAEDTAVVDTTAAEEADVEEEEDVTVVAVVAIAK